MEVGERHAYRARGVDPLVEVEVLRIGTQKPPRVQVRFVAEDAEGRIDWVPPSRLKCPWVEVGTYVEREQRWQRLTSAGVGDDDPAYWAASGVIETALPRDTAITEYRADGALRVGDLRRLAELLQCSVDDLTLVPEAFQEDGDWLLPWPATLRVAQRLCELHPDTVLAFVEVEERKAVSEATYGRTYRGTRTYPEWHVSAEECAAGDQEAPYGRSSRDLVRAWCGQESVARRDELSALRAEVRRLGALTDRAIAGLRSMGSKRLADELEKELGVPVDVFRGRESSP